VVQFSGSTIENQIEQEPLLGPDGEIIAEPLFWYKKDEKVYACFEPATVSSRVRHRLEDVDITIVEPEK
jgi:hypothetical protein